MSILKRLLNREESLHQDWKVLNSTEQIDKIIEASHNRPIAIFKHSISCGISAMAKYQLAEEWDIPVDNLGLYYLDLINNRAVSNRIAERLGVVHQSPQIILVHKGEVIYHTSHHMISVKGIRNGLSSVA